MNISLDITAPNSSAWWNITCSGLLFFFLLGTNLHAEDERASPALSEGITFEVRASDPADAVQGAIDKAEAFNKVNDKRAAIVKLFPGVYHPAAPIRIEGKFESGLTIIGAEGGNVEMEGTVPLKLRDTSVLDDRERGALIKANVDIRKLLFVAEKDVFSEEKEIPNMNAVEYIDGAGLYQGDKRLSIARVPESGYLSASSIQYMDDDILRIVIDSSRVDGVPNQALLWSDGYFRNSYTYERLPITAIDGDIVDIATNGQAAKGQIDKWLPHLAINNVLTKLTNPGSYAILPGGKTIAIHPFDGRMPIEKAHLDAIIELKNAQNVRLQGISVGKVVKTAISISNSSDIVVESSAAGWSDADAITVNGGERVFVNRVIIHDTGGRGITLSGGDRITLKPSGNKITECVVSNFGLINKSYHAGVTLSGVGNEISGSVIMNGPHAGLIYFGNDHIIRNNEFMNLVLDGGDAGAVYVGRDWTQRGTQIQGNYFHDIGANARINKDITPSTIYLDDYTSGTKVDSNLFVRTSYGILVGGGEIILSRIINSYPSRLLLFVWMHVARRLVRILYCERIWPH